MKRLVGALAATAVLALLFGCGTTKRVVSSDIEAKEPEVARVKTVLLAWQGSELGSAVPQWVVDVADGNYSESALSKSMPDLKGKKIFVAIGYGNNLEFTRQWLELVDIEVRVTNSLERVATRAIQASSGGSAGSTGGAVSEQQMQEAIKMYSASLSNVRLSGLEQVTSFWTRFERYKGKEVVEPAQYAYYTVYAIDKEVYAKQLEEALSHIDETTTEAKTLKAMVNQKLMEELGVSSNNPEVEKAADSYSYGDGSTVYAK